MYAGERYLECNELLVSTICMTDPSPEQSPGSWVEYIRTQDFGAESVISVTSLVCR